MSETLYMRISTQERETDRQTDRDQIEREGKERKRERRNGSERAREMMLMIKELHHISNSISSRTNCSQLQTIFPPSDLPARSKISNIRLDLDSQACAPYPLGQPFKGEPLFVFHTCLWNDCPWSLELIWTPKLANSILFLRLFSLGVLTQFCQHWPQSSTWYISSSLQNSHYKNPPLETQPSPQWSEEFSPFPISCLFKQSQLSTPLPLCSSHQNYCFRFRSFTTALFKIVVATNM